MKFIYDIDLELCYYLLALLCMFWPLIPLIVHTRSDWFAISDMSWNIYYLKLFIRLQQHHMLVEICI